MADTFYQTTLREESEDVFAWLITLSHPSLSEPYRISGDRTEFYGYDDDGNPIWCTRRNGEVYITHEAFSFVPPATNDDGSLQPGKFVISWNETIMQGVMSTHEQISFSAVYVNVADPDVDIAAFPAMLLQSVSSTGADLSADLGLDHFLDEPCGRLHFYPSVTPGIFKGGQVMG